MVLWFSCFYFYRGTLAGYKLLKQQKMIELPEALMNLVKALGTIILGLQENNKIRLSSVIIPLRTLKQLVPGK